MSFGKSKSMVAAALLIGVFWMGNDAAVADDEGTVGACAALANGQLRLEESDCRANEARIWLAPPIDPREGRRTLTLTKDGFNGIFGGLICSSGTLVSGGFNLLRNDVEIRASFIGPGFGLPRVYTVVVRSKDGGPLSAGDVVEMFVTCI